LAKITRERLITALLGGFSIAALFLFWYFGTKYRLEFYIRFKNVPTPYEVYQQLTQVGLSNKYLYNIAISVRRILMGFMIAIAVSLGALLRWSAAGDLGAVLGLLAGAAFVPALAVALGAWSRSSKFFEVVYLLLWYAGPLNRAPGLDFTGATAGALATSIWASLAILCMAAAIVARLRS